MSFSSTLGHLNYVVVSKLSVLNRIVSWQSLIVGVSLVLRQAGLLAALSRDVIGQVRVSDE